MRFSQKLPEVKKIANRNMRSYYFIELHIVHVCTTDFGLSDSGLGAVQKVGNTWSALVRLGFGQDETVRVHLDGFRTMAEAILALRTTVAQVCDERLAHNLNDAAKAAEAIADQQARAHLEEDDEKPLEFAWACGVYVPVTGTNEALSEQLSAIREYMGRGQGEVREWEINAYTARMIEHELIRQANVAERTTECEAFAQQGTGYGSCETQLDEHGNCPNAGNHRDSHTLRAL